MRLGRYPSRVLLGLNMLLILIVVVSPAAAGMFSGNHRAKTEPGNRYDTTVYSIPNVPFLIYQILKTR